MFIKDAVYWSPPANKPRVSEDAAAEPISPFAPETDKSPKAVEFPADAIVTYTIVLEYTDPL